MGQKVDPFGFRLTVTRDWRSYWYAKGCHYAQYLQTDMRIRAYLSNKLARAGLSYVKIERPARSAKITVYVSKTGVVIGRKGSGAEDLRRAICRLIGIPVQLNIQEIRKSELDATLVAQSIAQQIERRVMFRRVMKRAVQTAMKQGAQGVRIALSGRLGGTEIARTEWYREGRVPLHTLRAKISYAKAIAHTTYGIIGVKVWIFTR